MGAGHLQTGLPANAETALVAALDAAPLGVGLLGGDGRLMTANAAFGRIVEAAQDVVGERLQDLVRDSHRERCAEAVDAVLSGVEVSRVVGVRLDRTPGPAIRALLFVTAVQGTPGQAFVHLVDVTRTSPGMRAMIDWLFRSFRQSRVGMAIVAGNGRIEMVNPTLAEVMDVAPGDIITRKVQHLVHRDDAERTQAVIDDLTAGRLSSYNGPVRWVRRDGAVLHTLVSVTRTVGGPIPGELFAYVVDVTESVRAQEVLERAERTQRVLAEASRALSQAVDQEHDLLQAAAEIGLRLGGFVCGALSYDPDGGYRDSAMAGGNVDEVARVQEALAEDRPGLTQPLAAAIVDAGLVRVDRLDPEIVPPAVRPLLRPVGMFVGVGLRARDRVVGALFTVYDPPGPPDEDVALLEQLADRVALNLDNARLLATARRELAERRRAEAALRYRAAHQAALAGFSETALAGHPLPRLLDDAARLAVELGMPPVWDPADGPGPEGRSASAVAGVLELMGAGRRLRLRSASRIPPGSVEAYEVDVSSVGGYALGHDGVVLSVLAEESRFDPAPLVARGARTAAVVRIDGVEGPYGVLGVVRSFGLPFNDDDGAFLAGLAHVISGVLRRQHDESRLRYQAMHDALTGLPNRALLLEQLAHAVERIRRDPHAQHQVALLLLDLDRFKLVNDSYGHSAGDELLRAVAARLSGAVRASDTVARLGGDEFVVLCDEVTSETELLGLARRLEGVLAAPLALSIGEVFPAASIGIATFDPATRAASRDAAFDPQELLRDADAAMYRAKESGGSAWELFDEAMRERAVRRLRLESALRRAVGRDELQLLYQPVVDVRTGRPVAFEALLRWQSPALGYLTPAAFLDVLEESGLVAQVGDWVLREACGQGRRWAAEHEDLADVTVAVNLSARQLSDPELVDRVVAAMGEPGAAPQLVLEITESAIAKDPAHAESVLSRLRDLGVSVAVDDFGTGYSSLAQLKRFPVDTLKVDRSFVAGLNGDGEDRSIVTSVVALGQALGLTVVAEGVETRRQVEVLREIGCDHVQGYLVAAPLPAQAVPLWVRTHLAQWHTLA